MPRTFFLAASLAIFCAPSAKAELILVCGAESVFELDTSTATTGKTDKLWTWTAKPGGQLPEAMLGTFRTTDDCKPVARGSKVLISSSSGGCVLVERPSGKVLWYAQVPNAHSLELLPHDRIVAASSVSPGGNRLILFDIARSNQPICQQPLVSAHGVVWDETRKVLWALGLKELRCYELKDWDSASPALSLKSTDPLPDEGGHDLQPIPRSNDLIVTAGRHVHLFDRDKHLFRLHPDLGAKPHVKSVNVHPVTGQAIFIQASDQAWWSDTIGLLSPAAKIQLPGARLYKARWLPY